MSEKRFGLERFEPRSPQLSEKVDIGPMTLSGNSDVEKRASSFAITPSARQLTIKFIEDLYHQGLLAEDDARELLARASALENNFLDSLTRIAELFNDDSEKRYGLERFEPRPPQTSENGGNGPITLSGNTALEKLEKRANSFAITPSSRRLKRKAKEILADLYIIKRADPAGDQQPERAN